jgi:hypothetical protein
MTTDAIAATQVVTPAILSDTALQIARMDAEVAYKNLSCYRIQIVLEQARWHIEYYLEDPDWNGGGPHYVIDATTGAILSKKYYQ